MEWINSVDYACRGDPCGRPQPVDVYSYTGDRKGRP